ncbi:MAG: type II toxin-antitoxin system VapC family toxin [Gemmatimonas sp.]|uniref:type II toxin-antitoxin system VapC family toxin n=1 Tax=Gemmatimonas sp. TaxID=1962908 RepID=UPI00391F23C7|nr:PIN domain-containing protein [Gemmatimonadota bacterium]
MIVLVDTDVLVDLALGPAPCADDAAALVDALERGAARVFVAWHTVSNFFSLVSARQGATATRRFIDDLMQFIDIAPATTVHLRAASALALKDFEDAMQVGAALACGAEVIATRNTRDSRKSPIPALAPAQVLSRLL